MARHQIKLVGQKQRDLAHKWIDAAPDDMLIIFQDPTRSIEQNAKMWAMLNDISKQKEHNGKFHSSEVWKQLFMHSLGYESRFQTGLDGEVFPTGFKSSGLSVKEMAALIEWIYKWGAENDIVWNEAECGGWIDR